MTIEPRLDSAIDVIKCTLEADRMLLTSGESSSGQFMCNRKEAWDSASNTGASITRIGFGGPLYHNKNKDNHKETPKCIGNYLGPYSTVRHVCNEPGRALKPCRVCADSNCNKLKQNGQVHRKPNTAKLYVIP